MLGELAWCLHNEIMLSETPHKVYQRIFQLLLLPDCVLLLTILNTLYNLSFLGEQIATEILTVDNSLSILVSLLTLQVESFGDAALARVKLIDKAPSTNKNTGNASKSASILVPGKGSGGGVQIRIMPGGSAVQLSSAGVSKQIGTGLKANSGSQTPSPGIKAQSLKIGNTIIPTLNLGKKQQEHGGVNLSPLLQSSSNLTNPVVKAILSSSIGPLTLEQLQSLVVKSIPSLPQISAQKSLGSLSNAQVSSKLVQSPKNSNNLKVVGVSAQSVASPKPGTNAHVSD